MPIVVPNSDSPNEKKEKDEVLKQQLVFHSDEKSGCGGGGNGVVRVNVVPDRSRYLLLRERQRKQRRVLLLSCLLFVFVTGGVLLAILGLWQHRRRAATATPPHDSAAATSALLRHHQARHFAPAPSAFSWHAHRRGGAAFSLNFRNEHCVVRERVRVFWRGPHPYMIARMRAFRHYPATNTLFLDVDSNASKISDNKKTKRQNDESEPANQPDHHLSVIRAGNRCYVKRMTGTNRRSFDLVFQGGVHRGVRSMMSSVRSTFRREMRGQQRNSAFILMISRPQRWFHWKRPLDDAGLRVLLGGAANDDVERRLKLLKRHCHGDENEADNDDDTKQKVRPQRKIYELTRRRTSQRRCAQGEREVALDCKQCPIGHRVSTRRNPRTGCLAEPCKCVPAGRRPLLMNIASKLLRGRRSDAAIKDTVDASEKMECAREMEVFESVIPDRLKKMIPKLLIDECISRERHTN